MKQYFVTRSCESIANYIDDEKLANDIAISFKVRCETLDRACSVPGYKFLTLKEKNRIYDAIHAKVMKKYYGYMEA